MKPNRLSTKKHALRFAVILSALILAGCASTQSTTSSTSASSASSTVSTVSTSEESGADETDSTGGVLNITSADDGLVGKDAVLIKDATVHITASGDGIQAETSVLISVGEVNVTAGGGSANAEQKTGNAMFGGAQNTTADETLSTKGIKTEAALDITGGTPPQMPGNTSDT